MLDLLEEQPRVQEVQARPACVFSGAQADRVTFSYGGQTILSDLSLTVPENQVIGITGRSGAGKSTLLKLLMRFWDADSGQVRV